MAGHAAGASTGLRQTPWRRHARSTLDPRLTVRQIIGLRFACDDEFAALARRAVEQGLSEDAIKREIKVWRADTYRA